MAVLETLPLGGLVEDPMLAALCGGALMGVASAALRFGGISFDYSGWWANPASEWLSLCMYALLIIYMIKASLHIKK